ncbi:MAG: response regulator transcription factor [Pelagimonas sp.]|uniref:response regulator transcription factor n=1 Tax=Pelagimonas sp. TaxID=2073170 RepID=UPI003D6B3450
MKVLIVESQIALANLWQRHLNRLGAKVHLARSQEEATDLISNTSFDVIVLDLVLQSGSALAVSDFAQYRRPETRVVFVTNSSFFSDGSIFQHCANACAFLPSTTPPSDLATMVEHYAQIH